MRKDRAAMSAGSSSATPEPNSLSLNRYPNTRSDEPERDEDVVRAPRIGGVVAETFIARWAVLLGGNGIVAASLPGSRRACATTCRTNISPR